MSEAKHTRGPWAIRYGTNVWGKRTDTGHDGTVANCGTHHHSHVDCGPENEANAQLMAASPDMLAALRESLDLLTSAEADGWKCRGKAATVRQIRAAIAKATGEKS
jgi:hypothetical protein